MALQFGLQDALGKVDLEKLNVKGGSLAAAHPFAATGGRIIATLAKLLNEKAMERIYFYLCSPRAGSHYDYRKISFRIKDEKRETDSSLPFTI